MKRKRSLGLCFSCNERYNPGHKCRKLQLLLMEGVDNTDEEDAEEDQETEEPEIILQYLTGCNSPKTICILVDINRHQLVALVDSGAMHNFISDRVANRLNLRIKRTKPFNVCVADDHPLWCGG